jgi:hypothetical protein
MVPNEDQERPSDAQNASNASSEGIESSASGNEEEITNTSAGLCVEPERGMEMGPELKNEGGKDKEREWVGFSMEPIPEERDGEVEGGASASCEQAVESADQQQPPSTGTTTADRMEETKQEKAENEDLGMGMGLDCTTVPMSQSSDATTDYDRPETEI